MIINQEYPYSFFEESLNKLMQLKKIDLNKANDISFFVKDFLHPLNYYIAMSLTFDDWLDFEPETVRKIFEAHQDKIEDILGYHGAWTVLNKEGLEMDSHVLLKVLEVFSENEIDPNWLSLPEMESVCDSLSIIHAVIDTKLDVENRNTIIAICKKHNYEIIRPEYAEILKNFDDKEKKNWFLFNQNDVDDDDKKFGFLIDKYKENRAEKVKDFVIYLS